MLIGFFVWKISSVNGEMIEIAKRSSSLTETKLMNNQLLTAPNKKSRSDQSRTSCPPFKVLPNF